MKNIKEEKNSAWEEKKRREIGEERVSDTSSNRGLSDERPTHVVSVLRPLLISSIAARLGTTTHGQKNNTLKRYFLPVQLYVSSASFFTQFIFFAFSVFYPNNIYICFLSYIYIINTYYQILFFIFTILNFCHIKILLNDKKFNIIHIYLN